MIVPGRTLLWIAAGAFLPALTTAWLWPRFATGCETFLCVLVTYAIGDAVRGRSRARAVALRLPTSLRLTKDVVANLPVTIDNFTGGPLSFCLGAVMPQGVESPEMTRDVDAPAGASRVDWPCTGVIRGDHRLDALHLEVRSPNGLWLVRRCVPTDCTLRVYPNLRDKATAALFLRQEDPGARLRRQVGKGREFENLRAYLPGDNFEDVHWKATARRAFPIVKLYRVEHAQEVYAVVDASRLSAREGIMDRYVEAALHLALVAERYGDRFGLVTFSDRTQGFVRARSGMDHFRLCRETIYNLRAERVSPDFREVFSTLQLNLRRRSLLVFLTSLDDALLAETFEREVPLLARRHLVLVNVTQTAAMHPLFEGPPPGDVDSVYRGLAGQMLWNRMRRLQIALQNAGVKLAIVPPERIKTRIAAGYLDVKRRQAL
jgi:uncharacterized protein (DUF58 family)